MEDVMTRIERGAKWVDDHYPGELDRIAPLALDMGKCHLCVLGHISGDFFNVIRTHSMVMSDPKWRFAVEHGFAIAMGGKSRSKIDREYAKLTATWRSYLYVRCVSENLSAPQPQHQDEGELIDA